jgi:hypothetical protein
MSRRRQAPWAPINLPHIRGEFVEAIHALMQAAHTPGIEQAEADILAADMLAATFAELFWINRGLSMFVADASETIPEWTPSACVPTDYGLIAFAKPIIRNEERIDALMWLLADSQLVVWRIERGDLAIGIGCLPVRIKSPLAVKAMLLTAADAPHSRVGDALDVLAAAWLLMQQRELTETRNGHTPVASVTSVPAGQAKPRPAGEKPRPLVTVVDLKPRRTEHEHRPTLPAGQPKPERDRCWWVRGFWRQQACGPHRSQRRPVWIDPHVRGNRAAPVTTRVTVI